MKRSLLIGCGTDHRKKVYLTGQEDWIGELTKIDMNPNCGADLLLDMSVRCTHMPFEDETFDELGAFDTLEHWGGFGDWKAWFDEMPEYHRILKPNGTFSIIVPIGLDAIADPGHTRFFHQNHFGFLNRDFYERNVSEGTSFTDYRWYLKRYWDILHLANQEGHHLSVILRKA